MADHTLKQAPAKPSMLKSLCVSAQQKQISPVQLDNKIRNLLDLEDYTNEYEESDVYISRNGYSE